MKIHKKQRVGVSEFLEEYLPLFTISEESRYKRGDEYKEGDL
jgi:hypothetical protein